MMTYKTFNYLDTSFILSVHCGAHTGEAHTGEAHTSAPIKK